MEIKTLSSISSIPFTDTLEKFFDTYKVDEDIECYQFVFCPYGKGTSFDDLNKIKFKSRVVIFNVIDFMIDVNDNLAIDELKQFCESHPEQNFIISIYHLNLQKELTISNLYLDTIIPTYFTENYTHCKKKNISSRWLCLNSNTKVHKVMTVCYLLSKEYYENGDITFDMNTPTLVKYDQYKNITKISPKLKEDFAKGYARFKSKDFNLLNIPKLNQQDLRVAYNYNTELLPIFENSGIEIITGTMFFEKIPALSEKEIQSLYAKNFPIYINGVGMVREIQKLFDIDVFDDIIDHSYDEIENHFERLAAAIDLNQHLLNGSTNIKELWYDNQKRFEENCHKMDNLFHEGTYHTVYNHEKIKKALTHFNVSFTEI